MCLGALLVDTPSVQALVRGGAPLDALDARGRDPSQLSALACDEAGVPLAARTVLFNLLGVSRNETNEQEARNEPAGEAAAREESADNEHQQLLSQSKAAEGLLDGIDIVRATVALIRTACDGVLTRVEAALARGARVDGTATPSPSSTLDADIFAAKEAEKDIVRHRLRCPQLKILTSS